MKISREAEIFGLVFAAIVVGLMGWGLSWLSGQVSLTPFLIICGAIAGGFYLLALLMDKKDAGRKAGR